MNLHLPDGDARRLGWSLSLLAEWLRQADDPVLDELADFGFGLRNQPRRHGQRPPILTGAGGGS